MMMMITRKKKTPHRIIYYIVICNPVQFDRVRLRSITTIMDIIILLLIFSTMPPPFHRRVPVDPLTIYYIVVDISIAAAACSRIAHAALRIISSSHPVQKNGKILDRVWAVRTIWSKGTTSSIYIYTVHHSLHSSVTVTYIRHTSYGAALQKCRRI